MGLLDSVKKAVALPKEVKAVPELTVKETQTEVKVSSFASALLKAKEVPELVQCDLCGAEKHKAGSLLELNKAEQVRKVGKFTACFTCAKAEEERLEKIKSESLQSPEVKALEGKEVSSVSVSGNNKEEEYLKFFNQETEEISSLSDEQLRDRIIHWGETLFEVKIRQQKDIITLKERAQSKTKEERAKLRIDDLTYIPEEPIDSPVKEIQKRRNQKEKASESLGALGLDINTLLSKFKVK